jgi:hypothetical protein
MANNPPLVCNINHFVSETLISAVIDLFPRSIAVASPNGELQRLVDRSCGVFLVSILTRPAGVDEVLAGPASSISD